MSAEKKHDYHLVDPSPWPIFTSFACLVLAIGAIFYMHNDVSWGMYLGLALVIYAAYMWFRDVVIEAEHQGHHTPVVQIHHRYGMTLFIASEVMFFVAWFWAYFDISLFPNEFVGNVWPPQDIETFDPWDIPLINTLILLLRTSTNLFLYGDHSRPKLDGSTFTTQLHHSKHSNLKSIQNDWFKLNSDSPQVRVRNGSLFFHSPYKRVETPRTDPRKPLRVKRFWYTAVNGNCWDGSCVSRKN